MAEKERTSDGRVKIGFVFSFSLLGRNSVLACPMSRSHAGISAEQNKTKKSESKGVQGRRKGHSAIFILLLLISNACTSACVCVFVRAENEREHASYDAFVLTHSKQKLSHRKNKQIKENLPIQIVWM